MTMFYSQKTVMWGKRWDQICNKIKLKYQIDQNKPGKSTTKKLKFFNKPMCKPGSL